jgi:hypothetical protein
VVTRAGGCHCRAVRFTFDSADPLAVRACQCSFCRKHNSRNVSDGGGSARIESAVPLTRYRFGLGITDFLICPKCGCYVAAAMRDGAAWRATFNLNCFDDPHADLAAQPMVYDAEGEGDRVARRLERWTPSLIVEPEPAAA